MNHFSRKKKVKKTHHLRDISAIRQKVSGFEWRWLNVDNLILEIGFLRPIWET
jgi:hypothetical protein